MTTDFVIAFICDSLWIDAKCIPSSTHFFSASYSKKKREDRMRRTLDSRQRHVTNKQTTKQPIGERCVAPPGTFVSDVVHVRVRMVGNKQRHTSHAKASLKKVNSCPLAFIPRTESTTVHAPVSTPHSTQATLIFKSVEQLDRRYGSRFDLEIYDHSRLFCLPVVQQVAFPPDYCYASLQ